MVFNQKEDGSCNIEFSKEELEIIAEHKKIFLPAEGLRHFGNVLVKMVADWNMHFNKDVKELMTDEKTVVEGQKPEDTNDKCN
jgi:hypothetical protein